MRLNANSLTIASVGAVLLCAVSNLPVVAQQGDNEPDAKVTAPKSTQELGTGALEPEWMRDASLREKKVSFEVRRTSLPELLALLEKQTGVRLAYTPSDRLQRLRLTAHVKEMPLSRLMSSLVRLYGVQWQKQPDGSYELHDAKLPELELKLLQVGDTGWYRLRKHLRFNYQQEMQQRAAFAANVYNALGAERWKAAQGLRLAEMPETIQLPVVRLARERAGSELLMIYEHVQRNPERDLYLHLGIIRKNSMPWSGIGNGLTYDRPSLTLRNAKGQIVASVWPEFTQYLQQLSREVPAG